MKHPPSPLKHRGPTSAGAHPANMRPQPAKVRTTSMASVLRPSSVDEDADGDGPYFDLEFTLPRENGEDDTDSTVGSDCDDTVRSDMLITTSSKPQLASSLLKSATKFRVFMLRFGKSKSANFDAAAASPHKKQNSKLLVKFRLEEVLSGDTATQSPALSHDGKKAHPKDVIHKYLNKIKPLYNRASKRYGDKHRSSGLVIASSDSCAKADSKRLRKSRSASAAVATVKSPPVTQQEDVIESAIAHCKRSFNAGADFGLARCRSDPGAERDPTN